MDDDPHLFTPEMLRQWKKDAIEHAHRAVMLGAVDLDGRTKAIFTTQHDLAMRLSVSVLEMDKARVAVTTLLREWKSESPARELARSQLSGRALPCLRRYVDCAKPLEAEVMVVWGADIHEVFATIRKQTHELERYVTAQIGSATAAKIVTAVLYGGPQYEGMAFQIWLEKLNALAQDWLGPYVGRTVAAPLTADKVVDSLHQLTAEVRRAALLEWDIFGQ